MSSHALDNGLPKNRVHEVRRVWTLWRGMHAVQMHALLSVWPPGRVLLPYPPCCSYCRMRRHGIEICPDYFVQMASDAVAEFEATKQRSARESEAQKLQAAAAAVPTCVICCDKQAECMAFPCLHLKYCQACIAAIKECSACRAPVQQRFKVFA
jgi:hypothetical protein